MTLQEIIAEVAKLTPQEREQLRQILDNPLIEPVPPRTRNILEFAGIGAYAHDDSLDPQEYINQLRDEWDHRP